MEKRLILILSIYGFSGTIFLGGYIFFGNSASAWDALDSWLPRAISVASIYRLDELALISTADHRHPPLTVFFLTIALLTKDALELELLEPAAVVWFCGFIATAVLVFLIVRDVTESVVSGILSSVLLLTSPLLQNHAMLWGYAELWIVFAITSIMYFGLLYVRGLRVIGVAGIAISSIFLMYTKNTGFFLLLLCFFSGLAALTLNRLDRPGVFIACLFGVFFTAIIGLWLLANAFPVEGTKNISSIVIEIFGYKLRVRFIDPQDAAGNTFWALYVNQSFGSIPLIAMFLSFSRIFRKRAQVAQTASVENFLLFFIVFLLMAYGFGQIAFKYVYETSYIGTDTLGTRLLTPIVPLAAVWAGIVVGGLTRSRVRYDGQVILDTK